MNGRLLLILSNRVPKTLPFHATNLVGAPCEKTVVPYLGDLSEDDLYPMGLTTIQLLDNASNGDHRDALNILDNTQHVYASLGHVFVAKPDHGWWGRPSQTHIRQIDIDEATGAISLAAGGIIEPCALGRHNR
jgi:hypothetical protein